MPNRRVPTKVPTANVKPRVTWGENVRVYTGDNRRATFVDFKNRVEDWLERWRDAWPYFTNYDAFLHIPECLGGSALKAYTAFKASRARDVEEEGEYEVERRRSLAAQERNLDPITGKPWAPGEPDDYWGVYVPVPETFDGLMMEGESPFDTRMKVTKRHLGERPHPRLWDQLMADLERQFGAVQRPGSRGHRASKRKSDEDGGNTGGGEAEAAGEEDGEEQRRVEDAEADEKAAAKALKRSSESQKQAEEDRRRAEEARASAAAAASRREAAAEEDIRRRAAELARLEAEKKALAQKKLIAELEAKQRRYQMPYRGEGRTTAGEPSVLPGHQGGGGASSGEAAAFREANRRADVAAHMKQRGEEAKQKRERLESARANVLRLMKEKSVLEEEQKVEVGRLRRSEMQLRLGRLSDESLQAAVEQEVSDNRKKVEEVEAKGKLLEEQMEAAKQELAAAEDALQGK